MSRIRGATPHLIIDPALAARIAKDFGDMVAEKARRGAHIDDEIRELRYDLGELARIHRTTWQADRDAYAARGGCGTPREPAPVTVGRMNVAQVAQLLGRKPRSVRDLADRGTLRGEQARPGAPWWFDFDDVNEYLERRDG